MEANESRKLRWNLTIGLELMTVAITVPLAVLFIITAGAYDFYKSILLNAIAVFTLTLSYYISAIRFIFLGKILKPLQQEIWNTLSSKEKTHVKKNLLNFPIFNTVFFIIQWTGGLTQSVFILRYFFGLSFFELMPFAFLPAIVYPTLAVAHFFFSEATLVPILETPKLSSVFVENGQIRKISLYTRTVVTIGAIVISPIIVLSYLLVEETAGWIKLQDVSLSLELMILFIAITLVITARLFVGSIRRNATNLVEFFEAMSAGKLNVNFPMVSSDELGRSNKEINDFVGRLRSVIRSVSQESKNLSESSKLLEESTVNLSKKMQEQAASTEEMSAGVEEMTASIQSTAERAENQSSIVKLATNSLGDLEDSIQKVNHSLNETENDANRMKIETAKGQDAILASIKAIEEIKNNSGKMGSTVTIIHDISDKIGLLSLNAAIEAARAGDLGRGFSVVAKEISMLGEQTQNNTKTIQNAISKALSSADGGEEAIGFTKSAFNRIGETVDYTMVRINEVSLLSGVQLDASVEVRKAFSKLEQSALEIQNHTSEQAQTSMEFSTTISSIAETTEFLNEIVSDIDQLSNKLANQAQRLKQEVEFFII